MKSTLLFCLLGIFFICKTNHLYANNSYYANCRDTSAPKFNFVGKTHDTVLTAEFENGMFMRLKANGKTVHPDELDKFKDFIEKAQQSYDAKYALKSTKPFSSGKPLDINNMPQNLDVWESKFKEALEADSLVSLKVSYKIEFGDLALRINGNEVEKSVFEKYLQQYKEITGVALSGGYTLTDK